MAAPQHSNGPIDNNDIQYWQNKFSHALANSKEYTAEQTHNARPWHNGFFSCFAPIDTCFITCCCPCVTFGKTYHRTHKHSMQGYSPLNTSCLAFFASTYCCLAPVMTAFQRSELRKKYNLEGGFLGDLLRACCCGCCDLIQQEKESEFRSNEIPNVVTEQYGKAETMVAQPNGMH